MAERTSESGEGFDDVVDGTAVVYRTTHEAGGETSLSITVVEALAEAKGVSPVDIEQPLYDVVDPDALDRLFVCEDDHGTSGYVVFELSSFEITVRSNGDVVVRRVD